MTADVVSFRNPLYAGIQVGLPCPPPATIAGMLAAAVGGWDNVPIELRFGTAFHAQGAGVDLETYRPLDRRGKATDPTPKDRDFLARAELTVWLIDDLDFWERALRCPVWPLRLGRSQDLAAARPKHIELAEAAGRQGHAITPEQLTRAGTLLRLPTAISVDRARTRWDGYRYAATGSEEVLDTGLSTPSIDGERGQAVALLTGLHVAQFVAEGLR
ncbi:CRISPR-associated protein Cas5 [Nocardia panacis]|uniref:CRISPR-associated protein Cas5 n=1 Tax=Nocardia panacis TaxID=2340916 RepID=UPI001939309E|nr:CRISPR-associated protein Cas5 [Nocardia panacis]